MKISYEADQAKRGMSLKELKDAVDKAAGLAEANSTPLEDSKVNVFVNFGGGIKQLIVEV